ncbi:hypothetical protein INT43_004073 [Umbelopsis isabellina]|uniref:Uncharacterized protein n=1 Tax=Mortierella isabellina TaxID=91625 RepID=A0A8H7PTI3_MORIS|nr:hypothetical protein INT43_004073 [Umbelopsis isabellina]
MWLNPPKRLIGGAKQWSNIARSDFLCLQVSSRHRQHVAESHDQDIIYQGFMTLSEQLNELEDKVTFKRIAHHAHQLAVQSDKIINRSTSSIALSDEDNSEMGQNDSPLDSNDVSASGSTASLHDAPAAETPVQDDTVDIEPETSYIAPTADSNYGKGTPPETPEDMDIYSNPLEGASWIDPDLKAAFSYFFDGPQLGRNGDANNSKRKRKSDTEKKRDPQSLLDIPFMFISLLTYPDLPQESDNDKAQKIRFAGM